jgi:PAS domain-containing protein
MPARETRGRIAPRHDLLIAATLLVLAASGVARTAAAAASRLAADPNELYERAVARLEKGDLEAATADTARLRDLVLGRPEWDPEGTFRRTLLPSLQGRLRRLHAASAALDQFCDQALAELKPPDLKNQISTVKDYTHWATSVTQRLRSERDALVNRASPEPEERPSCAAPRLREERAAVRGGRPEGDGGEDRDDILGLLSGDARLETVLTRFRQLKRDLMDAIAERDDLRGRLEESETERRRLLAGAPPRPESGGSWVPWTIAALLGGCTGVFARLAIDRGRRLAAMASRLARFDRTLPGAPADEADRHSRVTRAPAAASEGGDLRRHGHRVRADADVRRLGRGLLDPVRRPAEAAGLRDDPGAAPRHAGALLRRRVRDPAGDRGGGGAGACRIASSSIRGTCRISSPSAPRTSAPARSATRWRRAAPTTGCGTGTCGATRSITRRAGSRPSATPNPRSRTTRRPGSTASTRTIRAGLDARIRTHLAGGSDHLVAEYRLRHADGSMRWMLSRGVAVRDPATGRPARMAGSQTDIDEQKKMEEQLRRLALHDPLTGLANRTLFVDRLVARLRPRPPAPAHREPGADLRGHRSLQEHQRQPRARDRRHRPDRDRRARARLSRSHLPPRRWRRTRRRGPGNGAC